MKVWYKYSKDEPEKLVQVWAVHKDPDSLETKFLIWWDGFKVGWKWIDADDCILALSERM